MRKTKNKGFALVEMIVVVALIALVLPIIYQVYQFGYETFTFNSRLIAQQYTVTNVMSHIRGDIQKAASVKTKTLPDVAPEDEVVGEEKTITLTLGYYNYSLDPPVIDKVKYWRIKGKVGGEATLQYSGEKSPDEDITDEDFQDVVTGLEMDKCNILRKGSIPGIDRLTIELKPVETNKGKASGRNLKESIKTEISVLYKD